MITRLQTVFASFGFAPIDTPALEYSEILLGKGSEETDKQMYRFKDNGDRDVSMRFDLTIPLARFSAMYINELGTPFKRYHIAPVWRAEKPQRGRYREFIQCDFDIIGSNSLLADAEVLAMVHTGLKTLGVNHTIRINNRSVLNGLLLSIGARDKTTAVLRAIDKLEKLGEDVVREELKTEASIDSNAIDKIFALLSFSAARTSDEELLKNISSEFSKEDALLEGVEKLSTVSKHLEAFGIKKEARKIDFSIARGLDYYTGTVFETVFNELPHIGSICSGGRYDNLASLYTKKELPGVGGSIGLDRLLGALEELDRIPKRTTSANVLVTILDKESQSFSIETATKLREAGHAVELTLESSKLGNQFKYAERKGIQYVVLCGAKEAQTKELSFKDIISGTQYGPFAQKDLGVELSKLAK